MDEPDSSSVATKSGDDESSAEEQKPSADVYDFDTHEAKKVKKKIIPKKIPPPILLSLHLVIFLSV